MRGKKSFILVILTISVLLASGFQNSSEHKVLFEKAKFTMETKGDIKGAIKLFEELIKKYPDERKYAAKSQLYIGLCYEKLGLKQAKQAQKAFQKVVDNYPEQAEAVKVANEKLSTLLRIQSVIEKADEGFKITKIHTDKRRGGSLSPDGKKLALLDDVKLGDVWLRDIAAGKEIQLTNDPVEILGLSWSPDSQKIAYYNLAWNIKVVSAKGGPSKTIFKPSSEFEKANNAVLIKGWTSDSKKVIYELKNPREPSNKLFAIPASGEAEEEITRVLSSGELEKRKLGEMALSPDGKLIAYDSIQDDNKDVYIMPVEEGETFRITNDLANDSNPFWSYDGKWLAFRSTRTGESEIWVVRVSSDGKPASKPIQVTQGGVRGGVWTKEGKIAYSSRKGILHIFTYNTEGSKEIQVTKNEGGVYPRWSPDGTKLVFTRLSRFEESRKREIWTMTSEGGEEKLLTTGEFPSWSPDGKMIAFNAHLDRFPFEAVISVIPAEGGDSKKLMSYDGFLRNLDWSPDGKYIAFSYSRGKNEKNPIPDSRIGIEDIFIMPVDGGEPKRLTQMGKKGFQFTSPRWSPDGKRIAFRSLDYETWAKTGISEPIRIWVMDVAGGEPKLVASGLDGWELAWAPNGKQIISSKFEEISGEPGLNSRIYRVSAEGGEPEKLNIIGAMPDLSSDGKRIVFARSVEYSIEYWLAENFLPKDNK